MAAPELDDHIEEHSSFIRTPKQLLTVVLLAFVVPVTILVMLAVLATSTNRYDKTHPGMSDEAIAQRIKPIGQVRLSDGTEPEPVAAAAPAPAAAAAPAAEKTAAAGDGKSVYDKTCMACHGTGVAGAPKIGDKAAWEPRLKQGMEALYATSLKGKGAMPPKGGAVQLSDAEVKAAVDYMVSLVK